MIGSEKPSILEERDSNQSDPLCPFSRSSKHDDKYSKPWKADPSSACQDQLRDTMLRNEKSDLKDNNVHL